MALSNCPRCGKLFDNTFKDICQQCTSEEEKLYQKVRQYIKENRDCTIYECSDATEVPVKTIARFIKQGRINLKNNPNMMYPCEACGAPIAAGRFCNTCTNNLKQGFKEEVKPVREEIQQPPKGEKKRVSYNFVDFKNRDK
ncbi:TIGR03826 family flagellar region protein [Desulfuribacillus alkaliarsenatis]|uniref:Flagellar protein n=1 Tax=Desulfuribacillus alkaliarsenatis TaxID=766136 RepID=A0A1E5G3Q5_9FIRM|nr:TIGR03826 family flagellar region protein [Desulfuribacillus alkaliarsenatis]OEF97703.1 hypothetical protein BHF68_13980 [Desulfuribacillus alkaliarsenatis]